MEERSNNFEVRLSYELDAKVFDNEEISPASSTKQHS